jgi:hypothetical protein
MHASPFELLELPNGKWCVARLSTSVPADGDPVGFYDSRDEAELAIMRASPAARSPLAPFAQWLRQG